MNSHGDAAARAVALDPRGSFIVQAPAGSGKTELLAQRYLRLLATIDAPEQILALTFTRKAAAEMRSRILHAIDAAGGAPPSSAHERTTWELARAVRATDARHQWRLIEHPSRLRIQTIDALNASLSRRLPVLAGTGAALKPTNDPSPLYELAGRRLIERLGEESSVAAQLEVLIVHLGNRVDRIVELLCDLLAKRDQWLHPVIRARATADLRRTLEGTLQKLVRRHLELLCESLGTQRCGDLLALVQYSANNLLANASLAPARRAAFERALVQPALSAETDSLPVWRAVANMLFKEDGDLYSRVDTRHGFPPGEVKMRMSSLLKALAEDIQTCERLAELRTLPDPAYSDEQWRTLQALLELLPATTAELQIVFQARGEADYVEIALRALQALGTPEEPTDLALAFDHRLHHVLVDEFQDTSFAQLDLLERLTAGWVDGDGRTLFCVGDPMQSIYRFRQAEVGLFIELQRHGLRSLRLTPLRLEANFRSAPVLVDWVNRVFPHVLARHSDAEQGAVEYSASVAALKTDGGVHVHAFVNPERNAEAERVVSIVRDVLARDEHGRVAVLVTARTHVEAIARALNEASIAFQAIEIEQLRERPVVQDLIALTRALVHLADRTAWLSILRAPWCGVTLSDLHTLAERPEATLEAAIDGALRCEPSGFSQDGRERLARFHAVIDSALAERGRWPLRIWVERTWNALCGPATLSRPEDLADAQAFLRRLEELEIAGDLEDTSRLEDQLTRLYASARVAAGVRVEVMTMHAAKGLEFDTVILPGLQRQIRAEDRELLRWARIAGPQAGIVLAPIKAEGGDADPIYRWIELLEREKVLRERARLLYVAVTRTKRELHLLGSVGARERNGEVTLYEPRRGSMLRMLWHALAADFENAVPSEAQSAVRPQASTQKLRRLPLGWRAPEPPAPVLATALEIVEMEEEEPPFDWVTLTSRHVGTLVHRELDRMCRGDRADRAAIAESARSRFVLELQEMGVPADRSGAAAERVMAALERTLADERGRWLLGLADALVEPSSELSLSGVVEGQIVKGIIDRTFVDSDGVRWIVDFKTSMHEGSGLDVFLAQEVERYRQQLKRYATLMRALSPAEPIKAALYFPLMKQWREVEV